MERKTEREKGEMDELELNKRGLVSFIGHFGRYHNTLCLSPPNFS